MGGLGEAVVIIIIVKVVGKLVGPVSGTNRGQGGLSAWFFGEAHGGGGGRGWVWEGGEEGVAVSHNMGARGPSREARAEKYLADVPCWDGPCTQVHRRSIAGEEQVGGFLDPGTAET